MLVLSREQDQDVIIGDPLNPLGWIRVVRIQGDRVRLGFEFPIGIPINRKEVAEKIKEESNAN